MAAAATHTVVICTVQLGTHLTSIHKGAPVLTVFRDTLTVRRGLTNILPTWVTNESLFWDGKVSCPVCLAEFAMRKVYHNELRPVIDSSCDSNLSHCSASLVGKNAIKEHPYTSG